MAYGRSQRPTPALHRTDIGVKLHLQSILAGYFSKISIYAIGTLLELIRLVILDKFE